MITLEESNHHLASIDCQDQDAVEAALTERARAIAEFAAGAPPELLAATHAAGEAFRERLEAARLETRRNLDRMTKLKRGLQATLAEHASRHVTYFG